MSLIRREMSPLKGRFESVPYIGNKMFPSFGKKKIEKKNSIFGKKYYFLTKSFHFWKKSIFKNIF